MSAILTRIEFYPDLAAFARHGEELEGRGYRLRSARHESDDSYCAVYDAPAAEAEELDDSHAVA